MTIELGHATEFRDDVKIGRLKKRIAKLIKQRDNYKERFELYQKVISMQPFLMTRYDNYSDMVAERKRVKFLEDRVNEQALLIKKYHEISNTTQFDE